MLLIVSLTQDHKTNSYAQSDAVKEAVNDINFTTRGPNVIVVTDTTSMMKTATHIVYKNVQVLQTDGSTSDQNTLKSDIGKNISHNYVAPIRMTYKTLDMLENVNVRVPYTQSENQTLSLATKNSKITILEEGKNNIYEVSPDIKERTTSKNNSISTSNSTDIIKRTRRYEPNDAQRITNVKDCKKHTIALTYHKNEASITRPFEQSYIASLMKHLCRPKQDSEPLNNTFRCVINEYFLATYVAPDGKGYAHNSEYLFVRPCQCY